MTTTDRLDHPIMEITDSAALDDAMRHLRSARRRVAEVLARAEDQKASLLAEIKMECDKADARAEELTRADRKRIDELEALAAGILAAEHARDPKVLHIDSVWGRISSRATQPTVCWPTDDGVLMEWAQANGYIRTRTVQSVDKAAIRRQCKVEGARLVHPAGGEVPYTTVDHGGRSVQIVTLP